MGRACSLLIALVRFLVVFVEKMGPLYVCLRAIISVQFPHFLPAEERNEEFVYILCKKGFIVSITLLSTVSCRLLSQALLLMFPLNLLVMLLGGIYRQIYRQI